jgi:DNA repair protein RecN (Recombination protein N)
MLTELRIANFALIEQLHLRFQPGFTVLTGETGTGKSLLIDAIGLLVGGRASAEQIRSGEEEALLEASFHLPDSHPIVLRLRDDGTIEERDSELILKRVLSRSGRHRIYLNGNLCPLRILEELGGTLVDIHGQHEQQSLLSTGKQLDAVDAFGSLQELRAQYEETYRMWKNLLAQLEALKNAGADRVRLEELLRFQLQEIDQAGLRRDEEAALQAERQRLLHVHRLRELAEEVYAGLQSDEQGVLMQLGRMERLLSELRQTDTEMEDCGEVIAGASIQLKDLAGRLRDYADRMEADPDRQNAVEDRLDLIHRLKKKYGGTIGAVLATGDRAREELQSIDGYENRLSGTTADVQEVLRRLRDLAKQLSKKRREASKRVTTLVGTELTALKMEHMMFNVSLSSDESFEDFGLTGSDRVEFMLSSNTGEPPRPLARIASGGELSRIMLALKTVLAERDHVPVLVFDEIDTGVGGAVAAAMGTRLKKLGSFHQVFCITHLPQIASQAEHHLLVEKGQDKGRTSTSVKVLNGIGREEEIARMLGGAMVTKKIRETAAELIAGARQAVVGRKA